MSAAQDDPVVRRAVVGDLDALVTLRAEMFVAMGVPEPDPAWRDNARRWFLERLDDPAYGLFVVTTDGRVVAGAVAFVRDFPPSPNLPEGRDVLLNSLCVLPPHRGRGHGRRAFEAAVGWARSTGVHRIELLATPDGRPMYDAAGFAEVAFPTMRLAV